MVFTAVQYLQLDAKSALKYLQLAHLYLGKKAEEVLVLVLVVLLTKVPCSNC